MFYFAVFVMLFFGGQPHLEKIFTAWPLLLLLAFGLGYDHWPFLGRYFCYFAAGTLFAMLNQQFRWHYAGMLALCINFSAGQADFLTRVKNIPHSGTVIGLIITSFFAFFVIQNLPAVQKLRLPGARLLGALTYPVYLIHAYFGYMMFSHFANPSNQIAAYIIMPLIVIILAYAIHLVVETKLARYWLALFTFTLGRPIQWLNCQLFKR